MGTNVSNSPVALFPTPETETEVMGTSCSTLAPVLTGSAEIYYYGVLVFYCRKWYMESLWRNWRVKKENIPNLVKQ